MHEYLLRVRHKGDTYTATLRELSPAHPDERVSFGPTHIGTAATHPAAVLAAVVNARLPHFTEPQRGHYGC